MDAPKLYKLSSSQMRLYEYQYILIVWKHTATASLTAESECGTSLMISSFCYFLLFVFLQDDIMCTAYASAQYLKSSGFQGKVFLVGNPSIEKELKDVGISCIGLGVSSSFFWKSGNVS